MLMRTRMVVSGQVSLSEPIAMADAARGEFEGIVRDHARFVYKVVYSVLRNHHDAEDAVQETFLRFLRNRKKWADIRDRRAWLARTAWRVALDGRKPTPEVALDEVAEAVLQLKDQGAGADEIAATEQMMVLLGRLIAILPQDLRDAMTLSLAEELTSVEISEVLGVPEGSVRTRLFRAREILRDKLSSLLERKRG